MDDGHEAIPLMAPDEYVHEYRRGVVQVAAPSSFKDLEPVRSGVRWTRSTVFLLLACLVTLLSLFCNAVTFSRSWRSPKNSLEKLDVSKLRRPSLYLGLERVPEILMQSGGQDADMPMPSSPPSNTRPGWPSAVTRVNSDYPYYRFPQDGWVFLTEQDHTIMEFPPMSNLPEDQLCAFQAYFPTRRALRDKLLTIERDDAVSTNSLIRFTPLSSAPVDLGRLTWDTRPAPAQTAEVLVTLTAAFGHNQTSASFACPAGAPLRVEAACVGGGCRVEYDARPELVDVEPLLGIQLVTV